MKKNVLESVFMHMRKVLKSHELAHFIALITNCLHNDKKQMQYHALVFPGKQPSVLQVNFDLILIKEWMS